MHTARQVIFYMGRPFRDALEECLVAAAGCLCWIPCGRQDDSRPPTPTGRPDRKHKHHELLHDNRPWRQVTTNHATATRAMAVWHGSSPLLSSPHVSMSGRNSTSEGSMRYDKIRCQHAIAVHMSFRNIPLPSMKILYFLAYAHSLSTSCTPSTTTLQQLHTSLNNRTRHFMPILHTTHAVGMQQIPNS